MDKMLLFSTKGSTSRRWIRTRPKSVFLRLLRMLDLTDSESAPQGEEASHASAYQPVSLLHIGVQERLLVEPRDWRLGIQQGTNSVNESCSWHGRHASRLEIGIVDVFPAFFPALLHAGEQQDGPVIP